MKRFVSSGVAGRAGVGGGPWAAEERSAAQQGAVYRGAILRLGG